jgi:hypothetical protein
MASEIKVDTISEKTSAGGVTIDSVVHKDSAVYPSSADGGALGSASNEWSDLFLADSSVIKFGADQDTTLTHTDGTGLTLNSTNKLCFQDTGTYVGSNADGDIDVVSDGTAVDSINLESAGGITLDAGTAGSGVIYEDDGTEMLRIHNSSSDVYIESKVSDKDIYLRGNDGGSGVNALILDMSDAGAATLNNGLTLTDGDLVVASGHGVSFAATGGPDITGTGSTELLKDYEEGTFTAVFADASGNDFTMNSNYTTGKYVKVGSLVHIQGILIGSSIGSASGDCRIKQIPFTGVGGGSGGVGVSYAASLSITAGTSVTGHIGHDAAFMSFMQHDTTGGYSGLQCSEMTANGEIMIGGTYMAA